MKLYVLSRADAEKFDPSGINAAIISINETYGNIANLKDGYVDKLVMHFDDVGNPRLLAEKYIKFSTENNIVFKPVEDKQIDVMIEFIETNIKNKIDNFVIHCHAGLSRSQAVAKYIIDRYSGEVEIIKIGFNDIHHNKMIYNKFLNKDIDLQNIILKERFNGKY